MIAFISLSLSSASTARSLDDLTNEAVSPNNDAANAAIKELRGMGTTGLDALFAKYSVEIVKFNSTGVTDDNWKLVSNATIAWRCKRTPTPRTSIGTPISTPPSVSQPQKTGPEDFRTGLSDGSR